MFFLKRLFKRRKKPQQHVEIEVENMKPVELKDTVSIQNYVINVCEQMIDISKNMEEIEEFFKTAKGF
jgi:hypothetical protein